jgi:hypothetical protein
MRLMIILSRIFIADNDFKYEKLRKMIRVMKISVK